MGQLRRDDIDRFFDYCVHVPTRTLLLGAEVDDAGELAEFFMKGMHILESNSSDGITIVMNNMGGDEYHGLAIYDAIATSPCHITLKVYGHAMSMGSWILQAADERIIAPRTTLMLHYGSWYSDSPAATREGARLTKMMESTYLRRIRQVKPRYKLAELRKNMEADWFIPAPEAVKLGLADKVMEETE